MLEYVTTDAYHSVFSICPIFAEGGNMADSIHIILKSPDDQTPVEKYDIVYFADLAVDIGDAAGITLQEFYGLFIQADQPPCFEVPDSAFRP